jgi:hypothetical protein
MHGMNIIKNIYRILVTTLLKRTRTSWDIELYLREIGCEDINWYELLQC